MNPCRRCLLLALLTVLAVAASGCMTPQEGDVSSIPWNRPQSWEGQGALGGALPMAGQR
jgi:hypothetical protein